MRHRLIEIVKRLAALIEFQFSGQGTGRPGAYRSYNGERSWQKERPECRNTGVSHRFSFDVSKSVTD
jgi:hypothetical protein